MNDDFFDRLKETQEYKNNPFLLLLDKPNALQKEGLPLKERNNKIYIFAKTSKEIKLNTKFNVIFAKKNPQGYKVINSELKFISPRPKHSSVMIEQGQTALCFFEFQGSVELLSKLREYDDDLKTEGKDYLYLTNMSLMTKILKLLDD
jgi:hypothetical protein